MTKTELEEIRNSQNIADIASDGACFVCGGSGFKVNRNKNVFHCFSCGEGGDQIKYYMLKHKISFEQACLKIKEGGKMTEERVIDVGRIRPIGAKLLIRKCIQKEPEYIILPDMVKETTNFCEIIAVGNKCKFFGQDSVGKLVQVPDSADGLHFIVDGSSEYAIVVESVLEPITYDN